MNRDARFSWVWLLVFAVAVGAGCSRKPAYSDMDPKSASPNQNQNQNQNQSADAQANVSTPPAGQPATPDAAQPAAAPSTTFKSPTFLDQANGGIKDLPSYPNAVRVNISIGPVQGINTMSLAFTTSDSMDKIAPYFDRVIKANKWTVIDKIIDPEFSEWKLKKGEDHNAKVQVKKNEQTKVMNIIMVRGEKLEASGK